jgi:hypothetical protein
MKKSDRDNTPSGLCQSSRYLMPTAPDDNARGGGQTCKAKESSPSEHYFTGPFSGLSLKVRSQAMTLARSVSFLIPV